MMKAFGLIVLLVGIAHAAAATQPSVRVAVIGGMSETGFWQELSDRFEKESGIHVDMVATGPKATLYAEFKKGGVDLITMHSSDTIINLCADGFALDPQPWMKNDLVIVGPPDDPAGVRGMTDALEAMRKIIAAKVPFVVHASLGAQEVMHDLLEPADLSLDPAHTTILLEDRQRTVLQIATEKHAYTLVGRIPFRSGKLPHDKMDLMVEGDVRLRRPYVVAVTDPQRIAGARIEEARKLAAFLRSEETQKWIGGYGVGKYDDRPIFFPVVIGPATRAGK